MCKRKYGSRSDFASIIIIGQSMCEEGWIGCCCREEGPARKSKMGLIKIDQVMEESETELIRKWKSLMCAIDAERGDRANSLCTERGETVSSTEMLLRVEGALEG